MKLPSDAIDAINLHLYGYHWHLGCQIEGIGAEATITLLTTDLLETQGFIDRVGGCWSGYPLQARKVVQG